MHIDTATRQRWMRVLAHSQPAALRDRMNAPEPDARLRHTIRAPEIGLVQIQARMGGTGQRFCGRRPLTRAAIRLNSGTLGYSYVLGRDKAHAERCAVIDALCRNKRIFRR